METQYQQFMTKLTHIVNEIVVHGHGDMKIHISVPREDKRAIVIEAGKSYRFTIALSDIRS